VSFVSLKNIVMNAKKNIAEKEKPAELIKFCPTPNPLNPYKIAKHIGT
jgi:hypothetical protein